MSPHVNWDDDDRIYKMWYSAGGQYEPKVIAYATSSNGIDWNRYDANPVFRPDPNSHWERARVAGAQVVKTNSAYYAFYIGFRDIHHAAIGIARSPDGVTGWRRHPANPIIRPGFTGWDRSSCYKPYALRERDRWLLWYNGRNGSLEQIGLCTHAGVDLGF
jgi:hypothetical protein